MLLIKIKNNACVAKKVEDSKISQLNTSAQQEVRSFSKDGAIADINEGFDVVDLEENIAYIVRVNDPSSGKWPLVDKDTIIKAKETANEFAFAEKTIVFKKNVDDLYDMYIADGFQHILNPELPEFKWLGEANLGKTYKAPKMAAPKKVKSKVKGKPGKYKDIDEPDAVNMWDSWKEELSDDELEALKKYVNDDYFTATGRSYWAEANELLRKGRIDEINDRYELFEFVNDLDDALNVSFVPTNVNVYRGLTPRWGDIFLKKKGKIFTDDGFISTSIDSNRSYNWALRKADTLSGELPVVCKIKVPKGNKGAYLSFEDIDYNGYDELEILLPRGSKFKVADVKKKSPSTWWNNSDETAEFIEVTLEIIE